MVYWPSRDTGLIIALSLVHCSRTFKVAMFVRTPFINLDLGSGIDHQGVAFRTSI